MDQLIAKSFNFSTLEFLLIAVNDLSDINRFINYLTNVCS